MCKVTLKRKRQKSRSGSHRKVAIKEISLRSIPLQGFESVLINVTENKLKHRGQPNVQSDIEEKMVRVTGKGHN